MKINPFVKGTRIIYFDRKFMLKAIRVNYFSRHHPLYIFLHITLKIVMKSRGKPKKGLFRAAMDTLPNQYRFWDKNSRIEAIFDSIHGKRERPRSVGGKRAEGGSSSREGEYQSGTVKPIVPDALINNSKPKEAMGESAGN